MSIELVSLDIGGTVAQNSPGSITAQLAAAIDREFGAVRAAVQQFKTRRDDPQVVAAAVCAATGRPDLTAEAKAVLEQAARDIAVITPFDDVLPALYELRRLQVRIVLLSNVMGCAAPPAGTAPPLDDALDATFYSCDIGYAKPDQRAFWAVARHFGVDRHRIIHIGDALETDVCGARAAGCQALLIDRAAQRDGPDSIRSLQSLGTRLRDEFGVRSA